MLNLASKDKKAHARWEAIEVMDLDVIVMIKNATHTFLK
jgi:hypothetical protein